MWRQFWTDEVGATSIEYAVMGAMFALMCVMAYAAAGDAVAKLFDTVQNSMVSAGS